MGSHQLYGAGLVLDEKLDHLTDASEFFQSISNGLDFYTGPILPLFADDSLLVILHLAQLHRKSALW